jgi:hypothetical protein
MGFFSNYMCREQLYAVETSKFFGIFLSKLSTKKRVSFSQTWLVFQKWFPQMIIPCFSKMVSTNGNAFPLKGGGFP